MRTEGQSATERRAGARGPWSITSPGSRVQAQESASAGPWEWSSDLCQMSPIQLYSRDHFSGSTELDF